MRSFAVGCLSSAKVDDGSSVGSESLFEVASLAVGEVLWWPVGSEDVGDARPHSCLQL